MKKKSDKDLARIDDDLDIPPTPREFFKKAVVGKYYKQYANGRKFVRAVSLEEDVAAVFKDSDSVNKVLRAIIKCLPQGSSKKRRKSA